MPAAVSTTSYSKTDQVTNWNGNSTNPDAASNIKNDPSESALTWNARNQLASAGSTTYQYDGLGRRENAGGITFQYDGSTLIGWSAGLGGSYSFTTLPGGTALAGSFTGLHGTTTSVPLIDLDGTTIGLVDASNVNGGPVTTYTYDPSGTPTLSGTYNEWSFLYHGMEQEGADPFPYYYYTGNGQFYNSQMVRSLSEAGETGTSGPGSGPAGNAIAAPSGGGGVPSAALNVGIAEAGANASFLGGYAALALLAPKIAALYAAGVIPGIVVTAAFALFDIFDAIFGGSDTPMIPRQLRHNRHPLYPDVLGVSDGLIPDEMSAAPKIGPNPHPSNKPPLGQIPGYNRPWLGYNYCGPGQFPGRPAPVDPTDACCQVQDDCYENNGLSSADVSVLHPGAGAGPAQQACNQALCACLGATRSLGPSEHLLQGTAVYLFSCQ
jgi:hypothetical protein